MKDPVLFFLLLLITLFALHTTYLLWFHPGRFMKQRKGAKDRYKSLFPKIPDVLFTAFLLPDGIALWWGRIISIVFIILCLILLWVSAFGVPIKLP